ncbi:uncharacterized protein NPIL_668811 [Nephila pilipes]|uniref:Gustatory receptor n=1 Tax=Nephila pilipes TaxID=299642 RepID=A0A8X6TLZ6_NEPPI|nr:uncharacterized protein NPIL_668811 [Nephila pilipes]
MVTLYAKFGPDYMFNFFRYGMEGGDKNKMYMIACYKYFMYCLLFPTLPNLVSITYCVSCQICCKYIRQLCIKAENCSPKMFTPGKQIGFLKDRKQITKLAEEIQAVFSQTSFIICMANFMSCLSSLSQIIFYISQNVAPTIIEILFILSSALASMLSIFYNAGQIPKEMKRFSQILRALHEDRILSGIVQENSLVEKLILDENIFVLSGCDLIFFTRSGILTVLGTILTYGLLILFIYVYFKNILNIKPLSEEKADTISGTPYPRNVTTIALISIDLTCVKPCETILSVWVYEIQDNKKSITLNGIPSQDSTLSPESGSKLNEERSCNDPFYQSIRVFSSQKMAVEARPCLQRLMARYRCNCNGCLPDRELPSSGCDQFAQNSIQRKRKGPNL